MRPHATPGRASSPVGAQRPSLARTSRVTSPPSARPLRLAHDVADDHADRLHVAARGASRRVGVRVERGLRRPASSSSPPPIAPQALGLDDRRGVAAVGHERVEDLLGRALRDLLARDHADQRGQRRRARPSSRPGPSASMRATSSLTQLASGWRLDGAVGLQRRLEVVAAARRPGQQLRARRGSGPARASKRSARAAGSSGSAARARSSISWRDRDRRRGRARGSSGSRAPPPWSAAT